VVTMPRQAREKSSSGIYHIILRGINRQQIFEEEEDSERLLGIIKDCKETQMNRPVVFPLCSILFDGGLYEKDFFNYITCFYINLNNYICIDLPTS